MGDLGINLKMVDLRMWGFENVGIIEIKKSLLRCGGDFFCWFGKGRINLLSHLTQKKS
jgi:hypothetical protein